MDKKKNEEAYLVYLGDYFRWVVRMTTPVKNGIVSGYWEEEPVLAEKGPQALADECGETVFSLADNRYYYPQKKGDILKEV